MRGFQTLVASAAVGLTVALSAAQPAASPFLTPERPFITSVDPAAPAKSTTPQVLTVKGSNFAVGLTLEVMTPTGNTVTFSGNTVQSPTTTSFQVSIVLGVAGSYNLVVRNTDGGVSDPFVVKVAAGESAAAAPSIEKIMPENVAKDMQPQTLRVSGRNFQQGLSVSLTDPTGQVVVFKGNAIGNVTPTSFEASVVLDKTGDYAMLVTNTSGQSSNSMTFVVTMRVK